MPGDGGKIAVVIPALNEAEHLPATLASLREGGALIGEIIVADGGSDDATCDIARAAGAVVIAAPRGRGAQIAAGVAGSREQWLLILHADTVLAPGWCVGVRRAIASGKCFAYYGRLRFASADPRARIVEKLADWRSRFLGLPYGDQALLIPRALLDLIGGMPFLPLMEDVALARALRRDRLAPMDVIAMTDALAYMRDGWFMRSARNMWRLARFFAGADPEVLAARYRR